MKVDRKRHLLAFRARMGFVGQLESCICTWPLDHAATATEHDENCPTHRMIERQRGARASTSPVATQAELDDGAAVIAAMNAWADSVNRSTES